MRSLFVCVVALFVLASASDLATEQGIQAVAVANYQPGLVRTFAAAASPSFAAPHGVAVKGSAIRWGNSSAEVDVLGFAMRNPSDPAFPNDKEMAFYMGYFRASADWNPSTSTASVSASLAELVASYSSVSAYHDRDGIPGFEWKLGAPLYCVNGLPAGNKDCIEVTSIKDLKALTWNTIAITNQSCPTGYTPNCRIYSLTTGTTDGLFSITMRLASEPVLVGGVRIDPSYAKIDISINYPWATLPNSANLRLVLIGAYAGKAGSLGVQAATINGATGILFSAASYNAYFSWDSFSKVGGNNKEVYALGISGSQVLAYDCSQCDPVTALVIGAYKVAIGIWTAFGWSVEFVAFSWADTTTGAVVWDPVMGMADSSTNIQTAAALAPAAPALLLLAAAAAALTA